MRSLGEIRLDEQLEQITLMVSSDSLATSNGILASMRSFCCVPITFKIVWTQIGTNFMSVLIWT